MTFTITTEKLYLIIIFILMIVQMIQWKYIFSLKSEIQNIWNQIRILTINVASEILQLKSKDGEQKKS